MSGTIWIDEADREVSRMSATLDENYHVGFGLLASVAKGSNVVFDQALIRNEAWLPTAIALHLQARAFLVAGFRADIDIRFDQYQKFQTDAVQQPGARPARLPARVPNSPGESSYFCCSFCVGDLAGGRFSKLFSWA